ncbi:hypothetical protein A2U01_0029730, partial [Trifolium medium]|nr:hypothetical protein [Trifolium medium]
GDGSVVRVGCWVLWSEGGGIRNVGLLLLGEWLMVVRRLGGEVSGDGVGWCMGFGLWFQQGMNIEDGRMMKVVIGVMEGKEIHGNESTDVMNKEAL